MNEKTERMIKDQRVVQVNPILEGLVPRFLENRKGDVNALQGALGDRDFSVIQSIGHAIKGTGGGYGFDAVSALGGELEEAGRSQDGASVQQLIDELEAYLDSVKVEYGGG